MRSIRHILVGGALQLLLCSHLWARTAPDFNLLDVHGKNHELYRAPGRAVVLFFTGTGCPIARKNSAKFKTLKRQFESQAVQFWMINAYADEDQKAINKERSELGLHHLTYLLDANQAVALALDVERTAEVVVIDTQTRNVIYQGAIDDQFAEGAERPEPTEHYLADALKQFLAGEPVTKARTPARGCRIAYAKVSPGSEGPDYVTQVGPLLRQHCVECHRTGGVAPWSMTNHRRVANYADMLEEVLLTRRMPPWDPHPDYGQFLDARRLTRQEIQTLLLWAKSGAPRGTGPDPLEQPLPELPSWRLGTPDVILSLPEPQKVAAVGVEPYRYIALPNPFTNDVWLAGTDVKPGNRKVVHHVILYAKWPGGPDTGDGRGAIFAGWAPGASTWKYPSGVAKRLPAKAKLTAQLHYTTCGSEQIDQSEIALYLANGPQEHSVETRFAAEWNLDIPAGAEDARHVATYAFVKPATVYSLIPHMHVRGKWMRYELLSPDGQRETLLLVPRYDFNWQLSYHLKQPRHIPAGSWLMVTASFDNSKGNPANPDPKKTVFFGEQSWEEMFIGWFEAADDPQPPATAAR
jgi:peroxiredoxin